MKSQTAGVDVDDARLMVEGNVAAVVLRETRRGCLQLQFVLLTGNFRESNTF